MSSRTDAKELGVALGARIREARALQGVSLRKLAEQIGVSPATLSAIENGRTRVTAVRLAEIAAQLGVGQLELLPEPGGGSRAVPAPDPEASRQWRHYGPAVFEVRLQAALEAFVELGYHGSTMRDIAKRAGLSVPAIYHRYTSKQEMLVEILRLTLDDLGWRAEAAVAEGDDVLSRLSNLIECLVVFHTRRRDWGFVGRSELRSVEDEAQAMIRAKRVRIQRLLDSQIREAVDLGLCTAKSPSGASRAIVLMCQGTSQWYTDTGPQTPEDVAAEYLGYSLSLLGWRQPA